MNSSTKKPWDNQILQIKKLKVKLLKISPRIWLKIKLNKEGNNVKEIKLLKLDENQEQITIITNDNKINIFTPITEKYYNTNKNKYKELIKYGLIENDKFQRFLTHPIENYITNN